MELEVSSAVLAGLRAEAAAAHPLECCGILLGAGSAISAHVPTRNVHPEPARHFEIDPQALVDAFRAERAGGAQVVGYYHSHPSGPPGPSATDRAMAAHDGRVWAIVGGDEVRFWRDNRQGFEALSYIAR